MHKLKQKWFPILLSLMVVMASFWFELTSNKSVNLVHERLNNIIYDMRLTLALPHNEDSVISNVVIVDIDDRSLKEVDRWPWPRNIMANLVTKLREAGAIVIALDIVFAEQERNITDRLLSDNRNINLNPQTKSDLKKIAPLFDHDEILSKAISDQDVVMGFVLTANPNDDSGVLPDPAVTLSPDIMKQIPIRDMPGAISNIPVLEDKKMHAGFVTTLSDNDGVIRSYPLVLKHKDQIYASLALEAAKQFLLIDQIQFNFAQNANRIILQDVSLGKIKIPTDMYGQVIIPYQGFDKSFQYYSAVDVLNEKIAKDVLKNKLVIVGISAIGEGDLHTTPFETSFPGIEIHATIADSILSKTFPVQPDWAEGAILFMLLSLGLLFTFVCPFLPMMVSLILPLAAIAGVIYLNLWLWSSQSIYLSSVTVYIMLFFIDVVNVFYGFFFESTKRGELKQMFGQYVPSAHVEKMMESDDNYTFDGESREMSVLFADIRGFTSLSEKLSPGQLKQFLNEFFTPMTKVIFDNNGTIDKYVGDMIMAFWGAPLENAHHSQDAIRSGMIMLKTVEAIAPHFKSMGIKELHIGIGINTGFMNVGDMGSSYRRSYTVLGDSVNLASRLESATKFYGASMIISHNTLKGNEEEFVCMHLDRVKVKGKEDAVDIYEPLCLRTEATPELLEEIEANKQAQAYYYAADWDRALTVYHNLKIKYPTRKLYTLYMERIKSLKEQGVQPGWDGCYVKTEK